MKINEFIVMLSQATPREIAAIKSYLGIAGNYSRVEMDTVTGRAKLSDIVPRPGQGQGQSQSQGHGAVGGSQVDTSRLGGGFTEGPDI